MSPLDTLNPASVPAPAAEEPDPYMQARSAYAKQKESLIETQRKLMEELEGRRVQPAEKLMAFSQAMLTPGRTGSFGEAFGGAMGNLQKMQSEDAARAQAIAKMRMEMGMQQLGMRKEDVEMARQKRIQDLGKNLYTTYAAPATPTGSIYGQKEMPVRDDEGNLMPGADVVPGKSVQRLNPEKLREMISVDPDATLKYLQAQKTMQEILAPKTQKLGADETIFEQNEDGSWRAVMHGQGKLSIEEKVAMIQAGIDPTKIGNMTPEQALKLSLQLRVNKAGIDSDINEAMTLLGIPLSRINELTPVERAAVEQKILAKKAASAPKTINMATETELGKAFAKDEATRLSGQFSAATDAERLIRTASEMRQLLTSGKVITGPLAGIALQANRFVGDPKKVQDTQLYLNQMSAATLAAIKNSNLGTGQGFTDKDRQFLEQAVAGNITWDRASLQRLADLNEFSARASISRWNETVKKIPEKVLSGLPTVTPVAPPAFDFPKVPGKNVPILSSHPSLFRMQKDSLPPGSPYAVYENGKLQGYLKGKASE